ncbi:hypothetical protein C8R44DRAFT_870834 [Mycena epipterygia]|nr:hypothetical protein C8R44DRAFT_870834 [Mycena epipterygia]
MFLPAFPPFVFALTLVLCVPSILVQARWVEHPRRTVRKRDAFSSSDLPLASWIWLPEPDLLTTAPVGNVAFIKTFATPAGKTAASASVALTVDNGWTLWVNGQPVGTSEDTGVTGWQTGQVLSAALNASANVFSVLGTNVNQTDNTQNPAGLLAAIRIRYTDGSNDTILSDSTWLASGAIPADFPLPADISQFVPAQVITQYGSGPWGTSVTVPSPDLDPLNLTGSAWIWSTDNAGANAPLGTVGFRKTVVTPAGKTAASATAIISVDNSFDFYLNGHYIGSPPFDNDAPNTISSWEYAQRFTVALNASSNVFTVFGKNFPSQTTGGTSGAGLIAALLVKYTDGSSSILRTDGTWLTGPFTSVSSFLATSDSALGPSISQGQYGVQPWNQIDISDALNVLNIPSNNAAGPTGTPTSTPLPSPASTSTLPTFIPSNSPTPTPNGAVGIDTHTARTFFIFCSIVASFIL